MLTFEQTLLCSLAKHRSFLRMVDPGFMSEQNIVSVSEAGDETVWYESEAFLAQP